MAEEEALNKTGIELYRELLRVYPVAELDDYYKGNVWKDEVMKVDLQLVMAHRKEAGAPDPVPLEEVKVPDIPKAPAGFMGIVLPGQAGLVRPAGALGVVPPAAGATATAVAGGPVAELRLIALFVAKWKLDPSRTKMMLAKVTAVRRRYVIEKFKATGEGMEATNSLEQFIAECESSGVWDTATPATTPAVTPAATPAATPVGTPRPAVVVPPGVVRPVGPGLVAPATAKTVAPRPVLGNGVVTLPNSGVKRPLSVGAVIDPAKRPRIGPVGGVVLPNNAGSAVVRPPAWGGATGNAWGQQQTPGVRPPAALGSARPVAPRAVAPRPVGVGAVQLPAQGVLPKAQGVLPKGAQGVLPKAKAQEKPGELIRNLLQRF